jgi:hypothetical protein
MKDIKIVIHQADNYHREIPWPYSHIPRVGERFTLDSASEKGSQHVVTAVHYNQLPHGSEFLVVVTVDRG